MHQRNAQERRESGNGVVISVVLAKTAAVSEQMIVLNTYTRNSAKTNPAKKHGQLLS